MGINWHVRLRNPVWWAQVLGTLLLTALAYNQLEPTALTSWAALWGLIVGIVSNPYMLALCAVSVWNAVNDPTVAGVTDSVQAMTYVTPKKTKPPDMGGV